MKGKLFECKDDIDLNDLKELTPAMWVLFTSALLYCEEHNILLIISSINSDRKNINSASKTHEEFRAIDISTKGWPALHINRLVYRLCRDHNDIAAISSRDNIARAAIYHDSGYGKHIHMQVRRMPGGSLGKFIPITRS